MAAYTENITSGSGDPQMTDGRGYNYEWTVNHNANMATPSLENNKLIKMKVIQGTSGLKNVNWGGYIDWITTPPLLNILPGSYIFFIFATIDGRITEIRREVHLL